MNKCNFSRYDHDEVLMFINLYLFILSKELWVKV